MARKNDKSNEMDERDPTDDELRAIAGMTDVPRAETIGRAPSGADESDEEVAEHQARIRQRELDAQAAATAVPASSVLETRMAEILAGIEKRQAESGGTNELLALAIMEMSKSMNGMREATLQGAQMQADMQRRTTTPDNKHYPQISQFNLRGDKDFPRPAQKCEMFLPWPISQDPESQTREEVELLNLLMPGEWTILRTDRTKIKVTVRVENHLDSDIPNRLMINHDTAFNNDNHRLLPHDWIRQLVMANPKTKAAAMGVLTMDEEAALIAARKFNDGRLAEKNEQLVSVGE